MCKCEVHDPIHLSDDDEPSCSILAHPGPSVHASPYPVPNMARSEIEQRNWMQAQLARSHFKTLPKLYDFALKKLETVFKCKITGSAPSSIVRMSILQSKPQCLVAKLPHNPTQHYRSKKVYKDSTFARLLAMSCNKTGKYLDMNDFKKSMRTVFDCDTTVNLKNWRDNRCTCEYIYLTRLSRLPDPNDIYQFSLIT